MFRKRLKGLLAMVLAGSIATTALPLTASAGIIGDITVYNGDTSKELNYADFQSDTLVSGNLNSNSLWGVYYSYNSYDSGEILDSGTIVESVSGDKLVEKIDCIASLGGPPHTDYENVKIRAQHKYIVTTEDPSTTSISIDSVKTTSTFPLEISLSEYGFTASPLIDHYSCTAWYGVPGLNSTIVDHSSLVESIVKSVTSSADSEKITVGMEAFAGLYSEDIDTVAGDKAEYIFENGITILYLEPEYKTFDIPVLNTVLQPEMNGSTPKTVSITQGSSGDIDGNMEDFYLCYIDRTNKIVKISDNTMSTISEVWNNLGGFISGITNYDESKLCLVRNVTARVYGRGREDEVFTTKDFITGNIAGNSALRYLYVEAPAKSIWRVVANGSDKCFFATKDKIADAINSCLTDKPNASEITFTEYPFIYVTGTTPTAGGSIASENKFVAETLKDGSLKTISDLLAELAEAIPPASGKNYDVTGWELWSAGTDCGSLVDLEKINFNTSGVTGVTADMFDKAGSSYPVIYFPQVEIAPSLEVTAPVAGETPSTEYKIVDKVGGYSVVSVEWSCDGILLGENDKFKAGKKYTVRFELSADVNLLFVDSTPVTINGEKADTSYEEIVGFYASRSFTTAPEKPQNVKATAGNGKVDLSWEAGEGAFYYSVYLYNEDGTLRQIATVEDLNDLSCTIENLANGTEYGFLIRAVSEAGVESSYTAEDVVYATPSAPVDPKPQNVKATPGNGQVTLTWDKVSGATKYATYYYLDGKFTSAGQTTGTTMTVKNLTNGTEYGFLVIAYVNGAWSTYTTADLVYATPAVLKPVFTATAGNGQVTLNWSAVPGATKYATYYYLNGKYTSAGQTTGTSLTVKGLTNGTKYGFLVIAYVNGAWTSYTTADLVYATPVGSSKPKFTATAGDGQVTLNWNAVSGATKYATYYYLNGKYTSAGQTTATSLTVKNLTNGTKYGFLVIAYVNGSWTSYTTADLVYATPVGSSKPKFTATAGDGQVTLNWSAVSGATKYATYYYLNGKYTAAGQTTGTSLTVKGLTNGTEYGFLVIAYVNGAWSSFSTADLVYATPEASNKPVFTATAGNGQVTLNWNAVSGATKYATYYYINGKYTAAGQTTGTTLTVKGLTNGTEYGFLVIAYVDGAWSSFSTADLVYATPEGSSKPVFTATPGDGQVTLNWSAVTGATKYATYYYINGKYTAAGQTTGTTMTVKNLTNGTEYGFLVIAYVNGAWSSYTTADLVYATPN